MKVLKIIVLMFILLTLTGCPNPYPFPNDDQISVLKNSEVYLSILENDKQLEKFDFTISITKKPAHGEVVINDDQTVYYKPDLNYVGMDEFTYGLVTENSEFRAKVTINVKDHNNPPVAMEDIIVVFKGNHALPILSNDFDQDGDPLHMKVITPPQHGTLVKQSGQYAYFADRNFFGTDTFIYEITDGIDTSRATVTIHYSKVK